MGNVIETYSGNDLGAVYTAKKTVLTLWAPAAERVQVSFFAHGDGDCLLFTEEMTPKEGGVWLLEQPGNLDEVYYTYLVTAGGVTRETADPYAKAAGVNGARSMVVDLSDTNPDGFSEDRGPKLLRPTDAVICEVSVRDLTSHKSSGIKNRGKFLGLSERGTKSPEGMSTGLDYLKELGATHIQLMPCYDFGSIDESKKTGSQYNWGYDPVNYNVPEGSYSTDPFHGKVRIRQMKTMIGALHDAGLGVIMDVVYNHTYDIENSCFQKTAPDYFYRRDGATYSNASGCGNEVATERAMVRKYIIDSLVYWVREYHIDGFRFDLMGVFDLETMQQISDTLHSLRPDILLYGEGWTGGSSVYPYEKLALKGNIEKLSGVGAFSDDIRDGIRGHVFTPRETGFISGKKQMENAIRYSVAGACRHPQVDYGAYTYTAGGPWAKNPEDVINYISCHDNLTLWDKLSVSCPEASREELLESNRLGAAIVFMSQGIPFFLSGEEFARSKPIRGSKKLCENSFDKPGYTNFIRYDRAYENRELIAYYKGLIAFRKAHGALRMAKAEDVRSGLRFFEGLPEQVVAYTVTDGKETLFVAFNAGTDAQTIALPDDGTYGVCINGERAGCEILFELSGQATVMPHSALAAVKRV